MKLFGHRFVAARYRIQVHVVMPGSEARQQLLIGLRASLPTAPGIFAWGVIAGVATVGAGLAPFTAYLMCTIIYAGSAQLAALQMLATGTPIPIIGLAALIINSRLRCSACRSRS